MEDARRFARAVEQLRRSCAIAILATGVVIAAVAWRTEVWFVGAFLLPIAEAFVLLWYVDARVRVLAAEVSEALDRDVSEKVRESLERQRSFPR